MVFDNTEVKRLVPDYCAVVPYWRGAAQQIAWYDAMLGDARSTTEPRGHRPNLEPLRTSAAYSVDTAMRLAWGLASE